VDIGADEYNGSSSPSFAIRAISQRNLLNHLDPI
jgi:hypothetical protein